MISTISAGSSRDVVGIAGQPGRHAVDHGRRQADRRRRRGRGRQRHRTALDRTALNASMRSIPVPFPRYQPSLTLPRRPVAWQAQAIKSRGGDAILARRRCGDFLVQVIGSDVSSTLSSGYRQYRRPGGDRGGRDAEASQRSDPRNARLRAARGADRLRHRRPRARRPVAVRARTPCGRWKPRRGTRMRCCARGPALLWPCTARR